VKDQPVVRVAAEGLRNDLLELRLDLVDILARREAGAVANAEDMGVDREGFLTPGGVEDDVGGLAADAGKRFEFFARARDFATEAVDQRLAQRDHILRLGVEQADRLDRVAQIVLAQIEHLARVPDPREQRAAGYVDACIGGLRGQHYRDQQLIGIAELELGRGRGVGLGKTTEEFENLRPGHSASITSRIV
jgi:hypothetical protein